MKTLTLNEVTYLLKVSEVACYGSRFRSITSVWLQWLVLYPQSYNCLQFEFLTQIVKFFYFFLDSYLKKKNVKIMPNLRPDLNQFEPQILLRRSKSPTLPLIHFCPWMSYLFLITVYPKPNLVLDFLYQPLSLILFFSGDGGIVVSTDAWVPLPYSQASRFEISKLLIPLSNNI